MQKIFSIFILTIFFTLTTINYTQAVVHHRDVSYTPVNSVYSCTIRKQNCVVRKISYMQRNRAFYQSECTGSNFEQNAYARTVETDVRHKRFAYCRLVSSH